MEAFKRGEVFVKISGDGSRFRVGQITPIDLSEQIKDVLRVLGESGYFKSSAYVRHKDAINFGIDPAEERNSINMDQEKKHASYKIIKPTKYCQIEVSAEDADLVKKLEAVYNRGGKYSLKSQLCFQIETFLGAEVAQVYKDNQQLAPFRSAGHVQILRDNLMAVWNVIFYIRQYFDKSGFVAFCAAHLDRFFALRKKINESIKEYDKHAG